MAALLAASAVVSSPHPASAAPSGSVAVDGATFTSVASDADPRLRTYRVQTSLVDTAALGGTTLDGQLGLNVLLPAGYGQQPNRSWPVVMMLHGASGSSGGENSWLTNGDVESITAGLGAIVVLPEGGVYSNYVDWRGGSADPPQWEEFHMQQVLGFVLKTFRVLPQRRYHAIVGLSGGGQGALRYASQHPEFFGSVAAFSPGAPDMQAPQIVALFDPEMTQKAGRPVLYRDAFGPVAGVFSSGSNPTALRANLQHSRVYLANGNGLPCTPADVTASYPVDLGTEAVLLPEVKKYAARLRDTGVDVTEHYTCGPHVWATWQNDLRDAISSWGLFGAVPTAPADWTYTSGSRSGQAWQYAYTLDRDPDRLLVFTRTARTLTVDGRGTLTIRSGGCRTSVRLPATVPATRLCA